MARVYKVSYHDDEYEGSTSIHSSHPISKEEAKEALTEQLRENNIDDGEVVVTEFQEIKNPILKLFY